MDQATTTPAEGADPGAGVGDSTDPDPAGSTADSTTDSTTEGKERRASLRSDHPVFIPLVGFFTGMVFIIVIPGLYAAILQAVVGYERAEELFAFVLLTLVIPIGLLIPQRTRRFARYMLFGVVATAIVVVGVGALTAWILYTRDH